MSCDWEWPGSEKEFQRAIEINPNNGTARSWYGNYLEAIGRLDEAIAERRRALEAEPLSPIISTLQGGEFYFARRYDQAIEALRKALDLDPRFPQAQLYLGLVYEQKGMLAEAISELRQAASGSSGGPMYVGALGHTYAIAGQRRMAEESLTRLKEQSKQRYVPPYDMAVIYIGLEEKEQALKYLEMAYADHSGWMVWVGVDPRFDGIRSDPRYQDLLRRMHLTP